MVIFKASRYATAKNVVFVDAVGKRKRYVYGRKLVTGADVGQVFIQAQIQGGFENLDFLTYLATGGSGRNYWVLADINKIFFPFDVQSGDTLDIPNPVFLSKY